MSVSKSPFSGLTKNSKTPDMEGFRANQWLEINEYKSIKLFMQLAESTNNKAVINVIKEVADVNNVHVKESLLLLHELVSDMKKFYT